MLTRFHKVLIAALAVQLVLIAIVRTRGDDNVALQERPVVAGFDAANVTRLQVFAGGPAAAGKPIDLVKRDAGWVLASGFDYPVDAAKVADVLAPIGKASAAAPLTTQAARHKQLHVADGDFERKLVITSSGKDLTLYLGGPAGARRTALRVGGSDDVFAVAGLSASTVSGEARGWLDPSYVKIAANEISKVVVQHDTTTVELTRPAPAAPPAAGSGSAAPAAPGPWSAAVGGAPVVPAAGESLETSAIDRLVSTVATIELNAPADPKRDASKPTATVTIERRATGAATPATTVIDIIADSASYWVHERGAAHAVLVDKWRLDNVVTISRDKLINKPVPATIPPPPAAQRATPGGPGSAAASPGPG